MQAPQNAIAGSYNIENYRCNVKISQIFNTHIVDTQNMTQKSLKLK